MDIIEVTGIHIPSDVMDIVGGIDTHMSRDIRELIHIW